MQTTASTMPARRHLLAFTVSSTTLLLLAILLALLSICSCSTLCHALSEPSLPATLFATWIVMPQAAANASDGLPGARCDHGAKSLDGKAQRPSTAIPFPAGGKPTVDPYAKTMWLWGGHTDGSFNDGWLLDLKPAVPTWTKLQVPANNYARWGFGMEVLPNGVPGTGDVGVTGLIFGGIGTEIYLGDVISYNFAAQVENEIAPSSPAASDDAPFARGYTEWIQLPKGAGTGGPVDPTVDSGLFYQFGGNGASDGVRYGANDHDHGDEWLFNLATKTWTRLGNGACIQNATVCTDSQSLADVLKQLADSVYVNNTLDFTTPLRPSDIYPMVQLLTNVTSLSESQLSALANVAGACTTSCVETELDSTRLVPVKQEGARSVTMNGNVYMFGGYSCNANGVQTNGGDACYSNLMWILDASTLTWRNISEPLPSSPWAPYWPNRRAYHSMIAIDERGLIVVEGGAYQDRSGSFYYENSVFAFDVKLERFVPFETRGVKPPVHWSATTIALGDDIVMFGGCQGVSYYDTLYTLRIGLAVGADNCYASGPALTAATAGVREEFTIQTRSYTRVTDPTNKTATSIVWGDEQPYGTGLAITAQLVCKDTPSGALALVQADVVESGNGKYSLSYTAEAGTTFHIFVYSAGVQIPGSPFSMKLRPQPIADPAQSSASGYGTNLTAKGGEATVLVQVKDQYQNEFRDASFLHSSLSSSYAFTATIGDGASEAAPLELTSTYNEDGTFSLQYQVPPNRNSYVLSLFMNSTELANSPFTVQALDPLDVSDGANIAFILLACVNILICLLSIALVWWYRAESVMRSSSPNFLYILICGSILSSVSVIFLTRNKDDYGCQSFHSFLTIGLIMSMSSLLAKSYRVARIFNARQLKIQKSNSDTRLFIPVAVVTGLMVLINVLWIGINPMMSESRPSSSAEEAAVLTFKACTGENVNIWMGVMIGFCASVLLYGVYLAVQTGHVPDQFNESRTIAAAVYNIFILAIVTIPLLFFIGSSSDFLIGRAVIVSLVILWCSLFNVLSLIGPKLLLLWRSSRGSITRPGGADAVSGPPPGATYVVSGDDESNEKPTPGRRGSMLTTPTYLSADRRKTSAKMGKAVLHVIHQQQQQNSSQQQHSSAIRRDSAHSQAHSSVRMANTKIHPPHVQVPSSSVPASHLDTSPHHDPSGSGAPSQSPDRVEQISPSPSDAVSPRSGVVSPSQQERSGSGNGHPSYMVRIEPPSSHPAPVSEAWADRPPAHASVPSNSSKAHQ